MVARFELYSPAARNCLTFDTMAEMVRFVREQLTPDQARRFDVGYDDGEHYADLGTAEELLGISSRVEVVPA